jgi:hypothetical protein
MVTLNETKLHIRVDGNEEDELIQSYILAATAAAADYLNVEAIPEPIPAPVRAAVLLQVGALYANREALSSSRSGFAANPLYGRLLDPYRVLGA